MLPRVKAFQVWNEPNLSKYLNPQWTGTRAASPKVYRGMLNGFYPRREVGRLQALVVTAGTAPFGDAQPGGRGSSPPASGASCCACGAARPGYARSSCPDPARFDVLAHHPYSVGQPRRKALNADDVSIPDIGKLTTLLRAAERTGRALPRKRHPLWVTETSYDSRPPDPDGVPEATHARWLARRRSSCSGARASTRSRGFRSATSSRCRALPRPTSRACSSTTGGRSLRPPPSGSRSSPSAPPAGSCVCGAAARWRGVSRSNAERAGAGGRCAVSASRAAEHSSYRFRAGGREPAARASGRQCQPRVARALSRELCDFCFNHPRSSGAQKRAMCLVATNPARHITAFAPPWARFRDIFVATVFRRFRRRVRLPVGRVSTDRRSAALDEFPAGSSGGARCGAGRK